MTVLPHRWLLRAPGNPRARLGALLKIRAPDLSNPSKPNEKELTSAKKWKDSNAAKQRSPGLCRDKAEAYLKGKDAESEEAQEHANNSSQNRR